MCKLTQKSWTIICYVITSLLVIKFVIETIFIIITEKSLKMNSTKIVLNNNNQSLNQIRQYRVLLWTNWYQFKWMSILKKHPNCPLTNCLFSDDRKDIQSYDAIVFHWYNTDPRDLPKQVIDSQKWVLYDTESPHYTNRGIDRIGLKKIDWTMTYRTDSDIYTPYGKVYECHSNWKQKYSFDNKTKSIAWFVSNCKTPSNRETYVKKLRQYIDVDIYGGCGPFRCKKYSFDCNDMIAKKYKFYLSFENSVRFLKCYLDH